LARMGSLGDIVFTVSDQKIRTPKSIRRSTTAKYGSHARHLRKPLPEFTGMELDKISLDIILSRDLGVDIRSEQKKILRYMREGKHMKLFLGNQRHGTYHWVITGCEVKAQYFDRRGRPLVYEMTLSLLEYPKQ